VESVLIKTSGRTPWTNNLARRKASTYTTQDDDDDDDDDDDGADHVNVVSPRL
jgi:hypothetical protein